LTSINSREVSWFEVYSFVAPLLAGVDSWPAAGTPAWTALADDDPAKLAAVLEAGIRWALRIDTEQEILAQAARDVSQAADWSAIAASSRRHDDAVRSGAYIPMTREVA
jgi:hypothetical protein